VDARAADFPLGAAATVAELEGDQAAVLARLREREPVSWLPALEGWLVTRRDLALRVLRDPGTFTVDDPRFSTAQVVGPSMLSLDGDAHAAHRGPFARAFRLDAVRERLAGPVAAEVDRLLDAVEPRGRAEVRSDLAGPLAVAAMVHALGLREAPAGAILGWYAEIVAAVDDITAGRAGPERGREAFAALSAAVEPALDDAGAGSLVAAAAADAGGLTRPQVVSNAAVLLFGGVETTEGMVASLFAHVLGHPEQRALLEAEPRLVENAVEESLRLEPAAAVVDRYATRDVELGGAAVAAGELVRVSLLGANRDPAVFPDPDRFDVRRPNARLHLAFAQGPHVCLGMHLARLEARVALEAALRRLPGLRLDAARPPAPRGLVFRKPPAVHVRWDGPSGARAVVP
jgi:cytochrome P450